MAGFSVFILFFCVLFSSCSFFHKDPVVLQINEQKWTASLFAKRLVQKIHSFHIENVSNPSVMESLKKQLMGELLMEYLIQKRVKEHSLEISEKEWKQALQKIQNSYSSKEVFDLYLKRQKTKRKIWEESVQRTLLHEKVIRHVGDTAKNLPIKNQRIIIKAILACGQKNLRFLFIIFFIKKKKLFCKHEKI